MGKGCKGLNSHVGSLDIGLPTEILSANNIMPILDNLLDKVVERNKKHPKSYEMRIVVDGVVKQYTREDFLADIDKLKNK